MRLLLLVLSALTLSGCHLLHFKKKQAESQKEPAGNTAIGTIEMINPDARFVVIKLAASFPISTGTEFISLGNDGKQSKLKVTPERKGLFVTADVVEGDPRQGDIVVRTAADADVAKAEKEDAPPPLDPTQGRAPTISISPAGAAPVEPLPLPKPN